MMMVTREPVNCNQLGLGIVAYRYLTY